MTLHKSTLCCLRAGRWTKRRQWWRLSWEPIFILLSISFPHLCRPASGLQPWSVDLARGPWSRLLLCEFGAACLLPGCPVGKIITRRTATCAMARAIFLPSYGCHPVRHALLKVMSAPSSFSNEYRKGFLHRPWSPHSSWIAKRFSEAGARAAPCQRQK